MHIGMDRTDMRLIYLVVKPIFPYDKALRVSTE